MIPAARATEVLSHHRHPQVSVGVDLDYHARSAAMPAPADKPVSAIGSIVPATGSEPPP